jgi:nitrogen regulatory protein PII
MFGNPANQNLPIYLDLSAGMVSARSIRGGNQARKTNMKRIEAVVKLSALDDFHRCAKQLGIFGFDLSEDGTRRRDHQRLAAAGECAPDATARVKVDFAVLDEETKPTVHAVLESVHPESIAIFKFDQDTQPQTSARRSSTPPSKTSP